MNPARDQEALPLDPDDPELTQLLDRWSEGDRAAAERVVPLVYPRLRRIAGRLLRDEHSGHTLDATGLVHEIYLELEATEGLRFPSRARFYALVATLMRRALVDHCRRKAASKRGGDLHRVGGDALDDLASLRPEAMVALDDALATLRQADRRKAEVVELRFFAGLTVDEIAGCLGISPRSVAREWRAARAMLRFLMGADGGA